MIYNSTITFFFFFLQLYDLYACMLENLVYIEYSSEYL